MLEAQGLSFSIAGFSLLRDIDLRVEPGKVTAIIGPNGAGKTSLLRLLTGEQRSTAGNATGLVRDTAIVDAALAAVDGSYLDKRFYTHMSGGEKQRVQLARVLAQIWEPVTDHARVLILDEPTSSFDLAHQQLTITNMRSFAAQGVGVLVVIHDLNMAARCADQLLVLSCGRIAAFGSPQQVLTATTIKQVFNVDVSIGINPLTGTPLVIA